MKSLDRRPLETAGQGTRIFSRVTRGVKLTKAKIWAEFLDSTKKGKSFFYRWAFARIREVGCNVRVLGDNSSRSELRISNAALRDIRARKSVSHIEIPGLYGNPGSPPFLLIASPESGG